MHSVFGKINFGGLKRNGLYLGLVLPSGGRQSHIATRIYKNLKSEKENNISNKESDWLHVKQWQYFKVLFDWK